MPGPIPIFFGRIDHARFKPDSAERYMAYLAGIEGKRVTLKIDKEHKRRSDNENRYYWGVVIAIMSEYTGYTTEETHEAMKWQFLRKPGEKGMPDTVRSTTSLNTEEMEEYLERVRQFAAEKLACYVPLPNEIEYDISPVERI
jgi:hypothetical protein